MLQEPEFLRKIPSVDELLKSSVVSELIASRSRQIVVDVIRCVLSGIRRDILSRKSSIDANLLTTEALSESIVHALEEKERASLLPAINATGVVLHTGLGRAPLSKAAIESAARLGAGYCNLEVDRATGTRGSRSSHLSSVICDITGAEDCLVVNNNAAAVLLALDTLAAGSEVIVSRSQLVEIGGSFRMPAIMEKSGAKLVEVGTTNRTHLHDYRNAITEDTGLILKVHTSNYRIVGFTASVPVEEMVALGSEFDIPVMYDIGSGALVDLSKHGAPNEPLVQSAVEAGTHVITFSGDKLLGGPQAGIIVGEESVIEKIKKNPLARALRVDKFTIAALESTFRLYMDEERALKENAVCRLLTMPLANIEKRCAALRERIQSALGTKVETSVEDGFSAVGGGSMPGEEIPTKLLTLKATGLSPDRLTAKLRQNDVPIFARIQEDKLVFDLRTVAEEEDDLILAAIKRIVS